jgi:hypothetical protein
MNELLSHIKIQFAMSYQMMEKQIEVCPDRLWNKRAGGYVFWQQIVHALTGTLYWLRPEGTPFVEPFAGRGVYPELEKTPETELSRDELRGLSKNVREQNERLFAGREADWLMEKSPVYDRILNLDAILMQIRHLQYHCGHCNSILRENGEKAVEWLEYNG